MIEKIYNIFTIFDETDVCSYLSYVIHEVDGSDQSKIALLKSEINSDYRRSIKFTPSQKHTRSEYNSFDRISVLSPQIEELLKSLNAPLNPLFIRTPVVNDQVFFNASSSMEEYSMENIREQLGIKGSQIDWLVEYATNDGLDITSLINDDFLKAIKLLYSNGLYVSAMKLLLTCIDSLAYIEYGSDRSAFIKWLKEYADFKTILISPEELWELRNGLLHMSNLHSSKVAQKKVRRISFYVGSEGKKFKGLNEDEVFYFNFKDLIDVYIDALVKWLDSYNIDNSKFAKFVERYDQTVSDSRFLLRKN